MNIKLKNFFFILPLILVSIYYSLHRFNLQSAIDGGLVLTQIVKYPENFSNITSIYYNSWVILHHISYIFLKLNFSVKLISVFFIFSVTFFNVFGIYLLSRGFKISKILALLISLTFIFSRINFGNLDYPVLFFSEHTYGTFAMSTFTLIAGLLSNRNYKSAGFFSLLLFSSHLVVGIWIIILFFLSYFFILFFLNRNEYENYKKILLGSVLILLPLVISYIFFNINIIDKTTYNSEDFFLYLNKWDFHRNIFEINYDYIFRTIILIIFLIFNYLYLDNKSNKIFFSFLFLSCIGSLVIYLLIKLFYLYIPTLIIRAMPTRLFLLHSFIGFPIIICIIINYLKKINIDIRINFANKKFLILLNFIFLFILFINFGLNKIKSNVVEYQKTFKHNNHDDNFWDEVNNLKTTGYFITGEISSGLLLRLGKKPYLIDVDNLDHIPYHPYTSSEARTIIESIYGLSFENPPIKFLGKLKDEWYKKNFEERKNLDWLMLSKKFNISGIIVPSNWRLQIKNKIVSKKFTAYILEE